MTITGGANATSRASDARAAEPSVSPPITCTTLAIITRMARANAGLTILGFESVAHSASSKVARQRADGKLLDAAWRRDALNREGGDDRGQQEPVALAQAPRGRTRLEARALHRRQAMARPGGAHHLSGAISSATEIAPQTRVHGLSGRCVPASEEACVHHPRRRQAEIHSARNRAVANAAVSRSGWRVATKGRL